MYKMWYKIMPCQTRIVTCVLRALSKSSPASLVPIGFSRDSHVSSLIKLFPRTSLKRRHLYLDTKYHIYKTENQVAELNIIAYEM